MFRNDIEFSEHEGNNAEIELKKRLKEHLQTYEYLAVFRLNDGIMIVDEEGESFYRKAGLDTDEVYKMEDLN